MSKASITQKMALSANGILGLNDKKVICIENPDTGEFIELTTLLADYLDRTVKLSCAYDYDYCSSDDE